MIGFLHSIFGWFMQRRKQQIDYFKLNPLEVQNRVFKELLDQGKRTKFGNKHHFDKVGSPRDFQKHVPIHDYEQLKPYIERTIMGEEDVLWPGKVKWFAKSSGTTQDRSKYIPMPDDALEDCHFKAGKDMYAIYFSLFPENGLIHGKSLVLGGSHQVNDLNEHSREGDLSAVLMSNLPFWAELFRTPELSLALLDDWENKMKRMAATTAKENVTSVLGVPTWTIVLIREILAQTGAANILEVWPQLELYVHGGVSFTPYRELFHELIPTPQMSYLETYNASEGFFAIQDDLRQEDMLLMLDYGIFYEFIPQSALHEENPQVLTLEEVTTDEPYALVISNKNGLWRYMIGDLVRFTSLDPFKIQVAGRTRHFINAFGEEVIVDNAERALAAACQATDAEVNDFTAGPVFFSEEGGNGAHQWVIEFTRLPGDLLRFTEVLDEHLQKVNSDYAAKRHKSIALRAPLIDVVAENTFYGWMKQRKKLGGQNKVPRLYNGRIFLDSVRNYALHNNLLVEQINS